uniref:Uncharacterized protein n=1 Tax=Bracon brevicornis TaxID=1563983 RepID=A0A6V7IHQ7_9HYME
MTSVVKALHFDIVGAPCYMMENGRAKLGYNVIRDKSKSLYQLLLHKEKHKEWMRQNGAQLLPQELGIKEDEMWSTLLAWMNFRFRTE